MKNESKRLKELASFFNYDENKVTFVNESQVSVKDTETGCTYITNLEDYIVDDMTKLYTKINNL